MYLNKTNIGCQNQTVVLEQMYNQCASEKKFNSVPKLMDLLIL